MKIKVYYSTFIEVPLKHVVSKISEQTGLTRARNHGIDLDYLDIRLLDHI